MSLFIYSSLHGLLGCAMDSLVQVLTPLPSHSGCYGYIRFGAWIFGKVVKILIIIIIIM